MTKLTDKEIKLAEQLLLSIKNMELHIGYNIMIPEIKTDKTAKIS